MALNNERDALDDGRAAFQLHWYIYFLNLCPLHIINNVHQQIQNVHFDDLWHIYTPGNKSSNPNKSTCKRFLYTDIVIGADSTHNNRLPCCSLVVHLARSGQSAWICNGSFRSNRATRDVVKTLCLSYHHLCRMPQREMMNDFHNVVALVSSTYVIHLKKMYMHFLQNIANFPGVNPCRKAFNFMNNAACMRKTAHFKSGVGFLLRVSEVWRLHVSDLGRWVNFFFWHKL